MRGIFLSFLFHQSSEAVIMAKGGLPLFLYSRDLSHHLSNHSIEYYNRLF